MAKNSPCLFYRMPWLIIKYNSGHDFLKVSSTLSQISYINDKNEKHRTSKCSFWFHVSLVNLFFLCLFFLHSPEWLYDICGLFAYCLSPANLGVKYKFSENKDSFFKHCISSAWNILSHGRRLTNIWCMKEWFQCIDREIKATGSIIMEHIKWDEWLIEMPLCVSIYICIYIYMPLCERAMLS